MFIPDPDFYPSRSPIPDLGSRIKNQQLKRGVKIFSVKPFLVATNCTKLYIFYFFEMLKKKICVNFERIIELLPKKLSLSYQKYGFGIRDPGKTHSWSRIQGSKRHRIPDPQHWVKYGFQWRRSPCTVHNSLTPSNWHNNFFLPFSTVFIRFL